MSTTFKTLSSYLRFQFDQRRAVPANEAAFVDQVERAERQMRRANGPIVSTHQDLRVAIEEMEGAYARLRFLTSTDIPATIEVARAEVISALDWIDEKTLNARTALRASATKQGDQPC